MTHFAAHQFDEVWHQLLNALFHNGERVGPRGEGTSERTGVSLELYNPRMNILVDKTRNPQYRFMVAEWLWIWFGRDDVKTISRFNPHIVQFSDDGQRFTGAYGPPVKQQWPRILKKFADDPETRRAVIEIPRPSGPTKDEPCTLSLQFLCRLGRLDCIVTMRSSDVWLGLPYDVFNFSMLQNILAGQLGADIGTLRLQLGSSHLYDRDRDKAKEVLAACDSTTICSPRLGGAPPAALEHVLTGQHGFTEVNEIEPALFQPYAMVLLANKNAIAQEMLNYAR